MIEARNQGCRLRPSEPLQLEGEGRNSALRLMCLQEDFQQYKTVQIKRIYIVFKCLTCFLLCTRHDIHVHVLNILRIRIYVMWVFSRNVEDRYTGYTAVLGVHLFLLFSFFGRGGDFGKRVSLVVYSPLIYPISFLKGIPSSSRSSARSVKKCKKFGNCFLEY